MKPGNVLVDGDGDVHLTDFGIARLLDSSAVTAITETGLVMGTAAYLAPEQVRGETAGPAADVYSLGLVLLEAITGERAYEGPPTEAAVARLQRAPEIPVVTPWLASVLTAMTAIDPARRPHAKAVENVFADRSATSEHTAVMPVPSLASRPPTALKKRGPLLAAVAAVLVALALILTVVGGKTSGGPAPAPTSTTTATSVPSTTAAVTPPPTTVPPATPPQRGDDKGKNGRGDDNNGNGGD